MTWYTCVRGLVLRGPIHFRMATKEETEALHESIRQELQRETEYFKKLNEKLEEHND
jgi:hypothetical protein